MRVFFPIMMGALLLGTFPGKVGAQEKPEGEDVARSAYVISLKDFGSEDIAYLTLPQTPPRIGVLVVPGPTGLSRKVKNQCDLLAANGFLVLAVDLYNGQVPKSQAEAMRLQHEVRPDAAFRIIEAGRRFFKESPRFFTPTYVMMGWTFNGALTLDANNRMKDAAGLILVEPNPVDPKALDRLRVPTLIITSFEDTGWNTLLADAVRGGFNRRNPVEPIRKEAPLGFMMTEFAERDHFDVWTRIITFIQQTGDADPRAASGPTPPKRGNFFQRLFD
jgi:dienelactone hydrolase